jgi:hypothetical protein
MGVWGWLKSVFNPPVHQLYHELREHAPLAIFYPGVWRYRVMTVGAGQTRWGRCLLVVTHDGLTVYINRQQQAAVGFHCAPANLRWFGRPVKYKPGTNHLLLHAEQPEDRRWQVLELRASQYYMQALIRAMKVIATPEQVVAYRRRRPYIHYGPAAASPAAQDIDGAWELGEEHLLYITPAFLVIVGGVEVVRVVPLEQVHIIEPLARLDSAAGEGLVRLSAGIEVLTFAVADHQAAAQALATAARRSLEAPVTPKKKKLRGVKQDDDDDEEDWDEDDF